MPVLVSGLHHLVVSSLAPALPVHWPCSEKKGDRGLTHSSTNVVEMQSQYFDWTQAIH